MRLSPVLSSERSRRKLKPHLQFGENDHLAVTFLSELSKISFCQRIPARPLQTGSDLIQKVSRKLVVFQKNLLNEISAVINGA